MVGDDKLKLMEDIKEKINAVQNGNLISVQKTVLDDILVEVSSLTAGEQLELSEMPEYKEADTLYLNAFNSFLMDKFKAEFIKSNFGNKVATNLLETIISCKNKLLVHNKEELEEFRKWKESNSKREINDISTD